MQAFVVYDSPGGRTARAAREIARGIEKWNFTVAVAPIDETDPESLRRYDLVCVGTPVHGIVIAGVGPSKKVMRFIERMPFLPGVPAAAFCTYGWNPEDTLERVAAALRGKGLHVLATHASWMFNPTDGCRSLGELLAQQVLNLKVTTHNNFGGQYTPVRA